MDKSEIKGFIAKRCAKELKNGDVVNLGIGLPTMIPRYLPEGVELVIHAELGIVGAGANDTQLSMDNQLNALGQISGDQGGQANTQIDHVAVLQFLSATLGNKAFDLTLIHYFVSPFTM